MHLGIIKIKDKTLYIDYKNKKIICYYKKYNRKIYVDNFLPYILSDLTKSHKLKFLYRNDYDIFLDKTTGYRHFYKNNQEDYSKFFLENGRNAILYNSIIDNSNNIKTFVIKGIVICINVTLLLSLSSSINSTFINESLPNLNPTTNQVESAQEDTYLTVKDLKNYINNSQQLSNYDKRLLINEEFFKDLSETAISDSRLASIDEKMTDITIVKDQENIDNENLLGWYSDLYPNIIHIADSTDDNTKIHEFIHLIQEFSEYSYIREASATLISTEYYNVPDTNYSDEVNRLKLLMELIGPEIIWNLNFSDTTTEFENQIHELLPKESANKLLELFQENPASLSKTERESINNEIDSYLYQIYNVLTNGDNELNHLYTDTGLMFDNMNTNKTYFVDTQNDNYTFSFSKIMPLEEAVQKNIAEIKTAQKKYIDKSKISQIESQDKQVFTEYNILNNNYQILSDINENGDTIDYVYNINTNQSYSITDAEKLGYIECQYWYYEYIPANLNETYEYPLIVEANPQYSNLSITEIYPINEGYEEGKHNILITYKMEKPLLNEQRKIK